ncbi:hypothetical protein F4803DRAFT_509630 [Xylaria telfairii]|nr:hypothetical protein F4803DRAFT_509630 [Xylaria telfairii]
MSQKHLRLACSTGQYDVVVAISEKLLNDQLAMYRKHPRVKKFSQIQETLESYILFAELGPIRVTIPAKDGQCRMLYHVVFDKATLKTANGDKTYVLDGTDLAFEVDIVLQKVDQKDLPQLQGLLKVPNEFSIQRLMLDFGLTETSRFNLLESSIKTNIPSSAPQEVNEALQKLTASWLVHHNDVEAALLKMESTQEGGPKGSVKFPILYYAMPPKPQTAKSSPGIYTPTAVVHQLYPFPGSTQDSRANCLLYLETINKDGHLPSGIRLSTDNGIFVTQDGNPSERIDGSMAINSKIFFDNYLIPILRPVVKQAELDCVTAGPGSEPGQYQWSYKFGDNPSHRDWNDDYFLMKGQQGYDNVYNGTGWFNQKVHGMENTNGWRWLGDVDIVGSANPEETNSAKLTGRSIINLQFQPGTNKAVLTGWSTMELHIRSQKEWDNLSSQIATTGKWSIDFIVEIGDERQLNIRPTWGGDIDFSDWTSSNLGVEVVNSKAVLSDFHQKFRESLEHIKTYLGELEGKMRQDCFVIAGHGYFFMKNPIFNNNGDLLVEIKYDGIPKANQGPANVAAFGQGDHIQVPAVINAPTKPTVVLAQVA